MAKAIGSFGALDSDSLYDIQSIEAGASFWNQSFHLGMTEDQAMDELKERACRIAPVDNKQKDGVDEFGRPIESSDVTTLLAYTLWARDGFPMIEAGEEYAAALMTSEGAEESSNDIKVPWKNFHLRLPRGLLTDETNTYDRIWVGSRDTAGPNYAWLLLADSKAHLVQRLFGDWMETLLIGPSDYDADDEDQTGRCLILARRLVIGALWTLQYTTNFQVQTRSLRQRKMGRHGPPTHRLFKLTRSIGINCKPWVRDYLEKGESPTVQSLVRGHFKNQAFGERRSERKVIWIEPYYRGPEDMPIAVRPLLVKSAPDKF